MKMDNEIIIASGNKGKIKEAQDIVADYYNYLTLYDSCEENREEIKRN